MTCEIIKMQAEELVLELGALLKLTKLKGPVEVICMKKQITVIPAKKEVGNAGG